MKGGKWFSLIDKVSSEANLYWAFVQVARNKGAAGVDRVTIDDFTRRQSQHLKRLTKTLTSGDYRPQAVRRVWIPKPHRQREASAGHPDGAGSRGPNGLAKRNGMKRWTPQTGSPQGAVISPLLSNIYLDPLDRLMASDGFQMVRYADDFVILCRSREDAERALAAVGAWTAEAGLELHPEKTCIVDVRNESFDFLGYHFCGEQRWPNAYFAKHGLFSMVTAYRLASQSSKR